MKNMQARDLYPFVLKPIYNLQMKKILFNALIILVMCSSLTSCATIFGGRVTQAQRTKPLPGEPSRPIRVVALIADIILFWPGTIVDFATGAIYRPGGNGTVPKTNAPKDSAQVETKTEKVF